MNSRGLIKGFSGSVSFLCQIVFQFRCRYSCTKKTRTVQTFFLYALSEGQTIVSEEDRRTDDVTIAMVTFSLLKITLLFLAIFTCEEIMVTRVNIIFSYLRKSSASFGKFSETIVWPSDNFSRIFGKCSEIFGKSSKKSSLVCLYNKQNNTWRLVDMEFLFSCSTWYLTSERSEGVRRYQVEHEKRNSISTRTYVLSSIYFVFREC